MFRPSYNTGYGGRSASIATDQYRSPSKAIYAGAKNLNDSFLTEIVLNTLPNTPDEADFNEGPRSPSRNISSAHNSYAYGGGVDSNNYANLSIVELDKRFNAALSIWSAALSSAEGAATSSSGGVLSPNRISEDHPARGPQFCAAKPSSKLKKHTNESMDFDDIKRRIPPPPPVV